MERDELKMVVGACGTACGVCRLFTYGVCEGCTAGDLALPEQIARSTCEILRCAAAKRIPYCTRDCPEYPCLLFGRESRICRRYVQLEPESFEAMDASAWTRVSLRTVDNAYVPHLEGPPAQLYVFCLGPFRVFRNGHKIDEREWGQGKGATQKIKAFLAYLVANVPRGATKDELCDLLWPDDAGRESVDTRFFATLHYLRLALEPGLRRGEESRFIVCRDGCYQMHPSLGFWVDAVAFEVHYRQAQRAEEQGHGDFAMRQYKLAEALYQGDYMAGIDARYTELCENDWCQWRRFRLKSTYVTVLLKLAEHYERLADNRMTLYYARRALLQDGCCEEAYCFAMRALNRAGRRSDLVRYYRLLERHLAQQEDREPSEETQRLFRELISPRKGTRT